MSFASIWVIFQNPVTVVEFHDLKECKIEDELITTVCALLCIY